MMRLRRGDFLRGPAPVFFFGAALFVLRAFLMGGS
jgi:hypothetical protein